MLTALLDNMVKHDLDLMRLYGWRYASFVFNPCTNNIWKDALDHEGHHCKICTGPTTRRCYEELHWVFCCAVVEEDGHLRFCGIRFPPKSPQGCKHHTYAAGHNAFFKAAWKQRPHEMPAMIPHEQPGWQDKYLKAVSVQRVVDIETRMLGLSLQERSSSPIQAKTSDVSTSAGIEQQSPTQQFNHNKAEKILPSRKGRAPKDAVEETDADFDNPEVYKLYEDAKKKGKKDKVKKTVGEDTKPSPRLEKQKKASAVMTERDLRKKKKN